MRKAEITKRLMEIEDNLRLILQLLKYHQTHPHEGESMEFYETEGGAWVKVVGPPVEKPCKTVISQFNRMINDLIEDSSLFRDNRNALLSIYNAANKIMEEGLPVYSLKVYVLQLNTLEALFDGFYKILTKYANNKEALKRNGKYVLPIKSERETILRLLRSCEDSDQPSENSLHDNQTLNCEEI